MKINWKKVWKKFDRWFDNLSCLPDWEEQQETIETLVNAELKKSK